METLGLICILKVVISAVFVVTSTWYSFRYPLQQADPYSYWVLLLLLHINYDAWVCYRLYHWYVVACNKTDSVFPFPDFSWKSVCESSKLFWQSILPEGSCIFFVDWIRSFCSSIAPVSGSTTVLTRYVWPYCVLWLVFLGLCNWFPLELQESLLLVTPLDVFRDFLFVSPSPLEMVFVVVFVLWSVYVSTVQYLALVRMKPLASDNNIHYVYQLVIFCIIWYDDAYIRQTL